MTPTQDVFVYEFVTGGGCYSMPGGLQPAGSMLAEGWAMLQAVAADLLRIPETAVHVIRDRRLPAQELPGICVHPVGTAVDERKVFSALSRRAAGTVVIAPETGGALLDRVRWVDEAGGNSWGPGEDLVAVATDKQQLAERLAAHDVPVPVGRSLEPGEALPKDFRYPAVLKPRDGAGSQDIWRIAAWTADAPRLTTVGRLEEFCPGLAASVALLAGPGQLVPLPPCAETLSTNGCFTYLGGYLPLPEHLAQRAQSLALRAARTLPQPRGYFGVDLVLGEKADGSQDFVIEVNPRVTTSYIGLLPSVSREFDASLARCPRRSINCVVPQRLRGTIHGGMKWLAIDIGGANLKAADGEHFAVSQQFSMWEKSQLLAEALTHVDRSDPPRRSFGRDHDRRIGRLFRQQGRRGAVHRAGPLVGCRRATYPRLSNQWHAGHPADRPAATPVWRRPPTGTPWPASPAVTQLAVRPCRST